MLRELIWKVARKIKRKWPENKIAESCAKEKEK